MNPKKKDREDEHRDIRWAVLFVLIIAVILIGFFLALSLLAPKPEKPHPFDCIVWDYASVEDPVNGSLFLIWDGGVDQECFELFESECPVYQIQYVAWWSDDGYDAHTENYTSSDAEDGFRMESWAEPPNGIELVELDVNPKGC